MIINNKILIFLKFFIPVIMIKYIFTKSLKLIQITIFINI